MATPNPTTPTKVNEPEEPPSLPDPCRDPNTPFFTEAPDSMQPVPLVFRIGLHWNCKACKGMHTTRGTLLFGELSSLRLSIGAAAHKLAELEHSHDVETGAVQVIATKAVIAHSVHVTRKVDRPLIGVDLMRIRSDAAANEMGRTLKARGEARKGAFTVVAITFQLKAVAISRSGILLSSEPASMASDNDGETAQIEQEEPLDDVERYKRDVKELEKLIKEEEDEDR